MTPLSAPLVGLATFAIKSSLILALAGFASLLLRKLGASYRHLIWTAAFCSILVLPVLQWAIPAQTLAVLPPTAQPIAGTAFNSPIGSLSRADLDSTSLLPSADPVMPEGPKVDSEGRSGAEPWYDIRLTRQALKARQSLPSISSRSALAPALPVLGGIQVEQVAICLWALGLAACFGLQAASFLLLARFAKRARSAASPVREDLLTRAGLKRGCSLLVSGSAPKTWGVIRPQIAVPDTSAAWPAEQLDAVVLHELIHIRRLDFLTQSLATVACALNWFNPLVWICLRAMKAEAERATDACVLMSGAKPSVYAEALLRAALESRLRRPMFASAGVPLMKRSKIEARVRAILTSNRAHRPVSATGAMATVSATLLLALPCAAIQAGSKPATAQSPQKKTHSTQKTAKRWGVKALSRGGVSAEEKQIWALQNHVRVAEDTIEALNAKLRAQQQQLTRMHYALADQKSQKSREQALLAAQDALAKVNQAKLEAEKAAVKADADSVQASQAMLEQLERRRAQGYTSSEDVEKQRAETDAREASLDEALATLQALKKAQSSNDQARASTEMLDKLEQVKNRMASEKELTELDQKAKQQAEMTHAEASYNLKLSDAKIRAEYEQRGKLSPEATRKREYAKLKMAYDKARAEYHKQLALQKQGMVPVAVIKSKLAIINDLRARIDELSDKMNKRKG